MILVDTNVFSALMRLDQEPLVLNWLDRIDPSKLRVSAITLFETQHGLASLPSGRRRKTLEGKFSHVLIDVFERQVIAFDQAAAISAGHVYAELKSKGRNVSVPDGQIAGLAIFIQATLATRNTKDFSGLGIPLINPWTGT